jgi:hypothetical protein
MTHAALRPLSLGELLDRSFTLYRQHFVMFVTIMAVPSVAMLGMLAAMTGVQVLATPKPGVAPDPNDVLMMLIPLAVLGVAFLAAYWMAYIFAVGATTKGVSELYLGGVPTAMGCYRGTWRHFGGLVLLTFVVFLRVIGLMLLCVGIPAALGTIVALAVPVIGGILLVIAAFGGSVLAMVLALRYALCAPALIMEGLGANAAVRRSVELTRGFLGRVFLLAVCAIIVTYSGLLLFQMPFLVGAVLAGPESTVGFWLNVLGSVMGAVGSAITSPLMLIGFAVLYFDARMRKEAFDLQLMAEALAPQRSVATSLAAIQDPGQS